MYLLSAYEHVFPKFGNVHVSSTAPRVGGAWHVPADPAVAPGA